jgi:DNA polymerase-3 subunit gamma/tau
MVEHLRVLLLLRLKSDVVLAHVSDDMRPQLEAQAEAFSPRVLTQAVRCFNQAAAEAKGGWQPQLPLEMAFIEAALPAETKNPAPKRSPSSPSPSTRRSTSSKSSPAPSASTSPPSSPAPKVAREPAVNYNTSAPGDGALTPETLQSRWTEFLNALRPQNLSLEALMHSCKPVATEENTVVLGFEHKFHRNKVEENHNKELVEQVLSDLLGQQVRVRCVLAGWERTTDTPQQPTRAPSSSPAEQIIEDPVVRAAVEDLGAQIVHR